MNCFFFYNKSINAFCFLGGSFLKLSKRLFSCSLKTSIFSSSKKNCASVIPNALQIACSVSNFGGEFLAFIDAIVDCVTIDSYPVAETVEEAKIDYGGNEANVSGNVRARRGGCFGFVNDKGQEIGFDCRSAARKSQFSVACDDPNQGLRLCCPAGDAVSK